MAIKISGTDVISDTRSLTNITGANGLYNNFQVSSIDVTDNINFTSPMMTCTLTAATTFTESGYVEGKSATLLLDTSSNNYTPTFSSNIVWKDNTEPTWADYQHWQITFLCGDTSSTIYGSAVGYTSAGAAAPTETVSLDGTTSTPESFFDRAASSSNDLVMGWEFDANGNIYKYEDPNNQGGSGRYLFSSTKWCNVTPSTTYYIRVSNYAGNNLSVIDSATLNSWLSLATTRKFWYRDSRDLLLYGSEDGTMKVEIASDAAGSNILATGYYQCEWTGLA